MCTCYEQVKKQDGLVKLSGEDIQLPATQDVGQKIWPGCLASLTKTYHIKHLCSKVLEKKKQAAEVPWQTSLQQ